MFSVSNRNDHYLSEASDPFDYEKPHYAGAGHAPFRPLKESLSDLTPVKNLEQLKNRKTLVAGMPAGMWSSVDFRPSAVSRQVTLNTRN